MIRNHYVPQYYLRGFCDQGDKIYCFDKGERKTFRTNTKNAAVMTGLYPDTLERKLAVTIEAPANQVLDKIRGRQPITDAEKYVLAVYMANLMRRGPRGQARVKDHVPSVFSEWRQHVDNDVRQRLLNNPAARVELERQWAEFKAKLAELETHAPESCGTRCWRLTPRFALWRYSVR